jgi:hypothetical protein
MISTDDAFVRIAGATINDRTANGFVSMPSRPVPAVEPQES